MNSIAYALGAIAITGFLVTCPQNSFAEGFTGTEFLTWPNNSQDAYIQSSITMAGVIGTQINPSFSECVDRWYFADNPTRTKRNETIRAAISEYKSYHPSGVILLIVQQECGTLD